MKRLNKRVHDRTGKNPAAEALFFQAQSLQNEGNAKGAQPIYERLLALEPNHAAALLNLGLIAQQLGEHELAETRLNRAIRINPDAPHYHLNLCKSLALLGKTDEAIARYEIALRLKPDYALAHNNLATLLLSLGRLEGAIEHFRQALRLQPDYDSALLGLGKALTQADQASDAVTLFRYALRLNPNKDTLYTGLAAALKNLGKVSEVFAYLGQALRLNPRNKDAREILGYMHYANGQLREARELYEETLKLFPDAVETHTNHSLVLLANGEIDQGWAEYDWRLKQNDWRRGFPQPFWNGENLAGMTLLIWGEQGVGDELLFASMFPDAIAAAGRCVIECEPRLASLFARSFPSAEVIPRTVPPAPRTGAPDIHLQSAAGSLARWLRPSLDQFPAHAAYLVADPARVAFWKERLAELGDQPKVGISWRSRHMGLERARYYTQLSEWGPILSVPNATFVNLQYDNCAAELADAEALFGVKIHVWDDIDLMNDLDEVAALTAALDLVVSAQNAVACIAGGLGLPVWSIAPHKTAWPMLGSAGMPWFPSMRLFTRTSGQPWDTVIEAIAQDLMATTAAKAVPEAPPLPAET